MTSTLVIRNVTVGGRRTSIRLEIPMWDAIQDICRREDTTVNALLTWIDRTRTESTLTSAVRSYIVGYYREAARHAERLSGAVIYRPPPGKSARWARDAHDVTRRADTAPCGPAPAGDASHDDRQMC